MVFTILCIAKERQIEMFKKRRKREKIQRTVFVHSLIIGSNAY